MHFSGSFLSCAALLIGTFVGSASAICPGYNYAFLEERGAPPKSYWVLDTSCHVVRFLDHIPNVCTVGGFKCSPPPIRVTDLKVNGLWYYCRNDPNKGSCPSRAGPIVPTSCCRNDGKRNFDEGLISKAEYEKVKRENRELDEVLAKFEEEQ